MDARTGLEGTLQDLRKYGLLLPHWVKREHLWMVNYGETHKGRKTEDQYTDIIERRFSRLPQGVQDQLNGIKFKEWTRAHPAFQPPAIEF